MNRRLFLASSIAGAVAAAPPRSAIPRWRGFNLLDLFQAFSRIGRTPRPTAEDDFRWVRDWGFNFLRIPMDYWLWIDTDWPKTKSLKPEDLYTIKTGAFDEIDRIVELGRKYGLHINLNFHRAPGYCVNNPAREPFSLWTDKRAEDAFVQHWAIFAQRYKGVSEYDLSFNLVNEPSRPREGYMTREDHYRVMQRAAVEIRAISPKRLIVIDSLGGTVVDEMIPAGVVQSPHSYWPSQVTHYRASWVDKESKLPLPTWPILAEDGAVRMGRQQLEERYAPWAELARQGIGVHVGETGCHNRTPHQVVLAWFEDVMQVLAGHGIGYALWNLSGSFGVLDSGRADVAYEDWYGRKLDRKLLALMQRY
jgi:endoglucanase